MSSMFVIRVANPINADSPYPAFSFETEEERSTFRAHVKAKGWRTYRLSDYVSTDVASAIAAFDSFLEMEEAPVVIDPE